MKIKKGKSKSAKSGKKFYFKVNKAPKLIRYYAPDIAANNTDAIKQSSTKNKIPSFVDLAVRENVTKKAIKDDGD